MNSSETSSQLVFGVPIFGISIAAGVLVALLVMREQSRRLQLPQPFCDYLFYLSTPLCFIGSHIFDALAYHPTQLLTDPGVLWGVNDGLSSFGLVFSATIIITFIICMTRSSNLLLQFWDTTALCIVVILMFTRMGCAIVKDHPGTLSNFFLAVPYPDGFRHDLGFYELLFLGYVMLPCLWNLRSREKSPGLLMATMAIMYGTFRIFVDALRIGEVKYFGWTPGQYSGCVCVAFGLLLFLKTKKVPASQSL